MQKLSYLLIPLLALASCATSADVPAALSQPLDTTIQRQVAQARLVALRTGRVKFKGPVVFQIGGANNSASATAAPKAKAPVAAGPHAVATETTPAAGGAPWWLWVVVAGLAFAGGFLVRSRLRVPGLG